MQDIIARMRAKKQDEGFTLIELLVVVVIIGVLVAIAVPVYLNYRQGAADKSAQSDVRGAVSAIEQYYTDNGNAYATLPSVAKQAASFNLGKAAADGTAVNLVTLSDKTQMTYVGSTNSYLVCATNTGGSGKVYLYDSTKGGSVSAPTPAIKIDTCKV
jgi:type IV pilus assembly protein PilA